MGGTLFLTAGYGRSRRLGSLSLVINYQAIAEIYRYGLGLWPQNIVAQLTFLLAISWFVCSYIVRFGYCCGWQMWRETCTWPQGTGMSKEES